MLHRSASSTDEQQLPKYARIMGALEETFKDLSGSRAPSETLHQFAGRLRIPGERPGALARYADICEQYADLRFSHASDDEWTVWIHSALKLSEEMEKAVSGVAAERSA